MNNIVPGHVDGLWLHWIELRSKFVPGHVDSPGLHWFELRSKWALINTSYSTTKHIYQKTYHYMLW